MAKVAEYKKRSVEELSSLMSHNDVIGVVNMENLPAKQLQSMRARLRDKVLIRMAKRRLMTLAIDQAKEKRKNLEQLKPYLKGMPALIFTKENPFRLAQTLKKSKSKAAAKAGQVAPRDIIIPAGPTQFAPGPIISELSAIGLKTGVEAGKVSVREEKTVITEGERFSQKLAEVLAKLGIQPMEIGLDLVSVYEKGIVYGKEVLSVDQDEMLNNLRSAALSALALSTEIEYPTKENISRMIALAYNQAKHIALSKSIMTDILAEKIVKEASLHAGALKQQLNIPEEEREKIKEQKRDAAEKSEEAKENQKHQEGEIIGAEGMQTKIGQDFKEEIESEKKVRESISKDEVEKLADELKKKGSLR